MSAIRQQGPVVVTKTDAHALPSQVVAIGASAGGLSALQEMLPNLPDEPGIAYILAQHMDPSRPSMLDRILQRNSRLQVKAAEDDEQLEADCFYIVPPDQDGSVVGGRIKLEAAEHAQGPRHGVDLLFRSVAREYGARSVGVVLSGTGNDGLQGIRAIKAAEGLAIVQDPATASYAGMPSAIVLDRLADVIVPADSIGEELSRVLPWPDKSASLHDVDADTLQSLVRTMIRKTGVAFDQYKESTLQRRIERRRIVTRQESLADYCRLVEESDAEAESLLQDTLISVTEFFRDPETFDEVRTVIKALVLAKPANEPIRVWIPGCATGEEAFSIAILLYEELGAARRNTEVQIFATDIDETAINTARKSVYLRSAVRELPKELVAKHFVEMDGTCQVVAGIRDMVTFAKHDLLQDPPFSRLDLVSCRNVLIYFKRQAQERLISTFHYVLKPGGHLLLGPSETVGKLTELFEPVDARAKMYRRRDLDALPQALRWSMPVGSKSLPEEARVAAQTTSLDQRIRDLVFECLAPPSVVVDRRFNLLHSHGDISPYIKLREGDVSVNVLDMVAVPLRVELRLILHKVEHENRPVRSAPVIFDIDGQKNSLTLFAAPIGSETGDRQQTLVLFEARTLVEPVGEGEIEENVAFRVRELEQELIATRDHLQTNIEELETSNEELQSVNEEYQSTTEELQSANEELQTTNEELQSTNEELNTANEELRVRSKELADTNRDLESILNSAVAGIIVLDKDLRVTRYSSASRSIFDLFPTSIGKPLITVGGSVDLAVLSKEIRHALETHTVVEREIDLGDKSFLVRVVPQVNDGEKPGLVVYFIELTDALQTAREARRLATVLWDSSDAITVIGEDGRIMAWNRGAESLYGYTEAEALEMTATEMILPGQRAEWQALVDRVFAGAHRENIEISRCRKDGHAVEVSVAVAALLSESGEPYAIATTERDLTPIREAEAQRRQAEFAHGARLTTAGEMAAVMAHELNQPITSIVHFCDVAKSIAEHYEPARRPELDEVLDDATGQAQRAGDIIRNLRQFLGRRESVRSPQKVNQIVRDTLELMRPVLRQHEINVELTLADELPAVDADATQLGQVVVNLLRNSIEAFEEAGVADRKVKIATRLDNNVIGSVHLTLHDNGPGMDKEIAERLFEPFHTDKPNGLGMGLWMSRSLVESHGGRMWCDADVDSGTTFHVSLPPYTDPGADS